MNGRNITTLNTPKTSLEQITEKTRRKSYKKTRRQLHPETSTEESSSSVDSLRLMAVAAVGCGSDWLGNGDALCPWNIKNEAGEKSMDGAGE